MGFLCREDLRLLKFFFFNSDDDFLDISAKLIWEFRDVEIAFEQVYGKVVG